MYVLNPLLLPGQEEKVTKEHSSRYYFWTLAFSVAEFQQRLNDFTVEKKKEDIFAAKKRQVAAFFFLVIAVEIN